MIIFFDAQGSYAVENKEEVELEHFLDKKTQVHTSGRLDAGEQMKYLPRP